MKTSRLCLLPLLLLLAACNRPAPLNPLQRAHADGLNKEAFVKFHD